MRILPLIIFSAITAGLVFILNTKAVLPAPLGKLLSPQHGIWQNAERADNDFSADLKFPQLKGKVEVYFDERLVPHVLPSRKMMCISFRVICMQNSGCGRWNCRRMLLPEEQVRSLAV